MGELRLPGARGERARCRRPAPHLRPRHGAPAQPTARRHLSYRQGQRDSRRREQRVLAPQSRTLRRRAPGDRFGWRGLIMRKRCIDMVYALAQRDERVVFIGSDLSPGLLGEMKKAYPERYYMEGVAEANIIGMAAGA